MRSGLYPVDNHVCGTHPIRFYIRAFTAHSVNPLEKIASMALNMKYLH